jgi:hypothetical protein
MIEIYILKMNAIKSSLLIIFLMFCSTLNLFCQSNDKDELGDESISCSVDHPAKFQGGNDSLWCFIEMNIDFNKINSRGLKGKVFVEIKINSEGLIKNIKVNPDYLSKHSDLIKNKEIEKMIIDAFSKMPKWIPSDNSEMKIISTILISLQIPHLKKRCNY